MNPAYQIVFTIHSTGRQTALAEAVAEDLADEVALLLEEYQLDYHSIENMGFGIIVDALPTITEIKETPSC